MCLKIYGYRTYCDLFSLNPRLLASSFYFCFSLFLSFLHPALSSSHPFLSLYDKSPTITSFSRSLSDSLQCNYTDCPLKRDTHTHKHTHTERGKPISNISGCSCSFSRLQFSHYFAFEKTEGT